MNICKYRNFSVLIPVHDRPDLQHTFAKSILAVVENTILPKQIIIVLDGQLSWDINMQIDIIPDEIETTVLRKPVNQGITAALNDGLKLSKFDIIARVDSDDYCRKIRFQFQLNLMEEGFDLVGSWIQEIDNNGMTLDVRKTPKSQLEICRFAQRRNPFNHMTVMFRKSKVLESSGYPQVPMKEDYALWVKMLCLEDFRCCNIEKILVDATTGNSFFKRRGSISALRSEVIMQFYLMRYLKKSPLMAILDLTMRVSSYIVPRFIMKILYHNLLRK